MPKATVGQVFTAPQAYIRIDNQIAGFVRNLQWQETAQRANVQGLGSLILQEVPPVGYQCTFTVDQYFIDLNTPVMEGMLHRLGSVQAIIDTLTLGELGFALEVYKKKIVQQDATTKMVTQVNETGKTIVMLNPCFVNNQSFSLAEGALAGYNVTGIYLNPISTINNSNE